MVSSLSVCSIVSLYRFVFLPSFSLRYWSARTFKMFNGKSWQKCTALTALLYPGFCFGMFFLINLFLWGAKSVAAIPFGTIAAIMALWFCVARKLHTHTHTHTHT